MSNVAALVKWSDMPLDPRPIRTNSPLTLNVTSMGRPNLTTSLDSISIVALPAGTG